MATIKAGWQTLIEAFPHARCLWGPVRGGAGELRAYDVHGRVVIIHDYDDHDGWQAYGYVTERGEIDQTLSAIDAYSRGLDYDRRSGTGQVLP